MRAAPSSAKRVHVRISALSSIKESFLYGAIGAPRKQSHQNARTLLPFSPTSVKNGPKTTAKPWIHNRCKIRFCTAVSDTTAPNWMTVHFEGKSAMALQSDSNRKVASQNNAIISDAKLNFGACRRRCWGCFGICFCTGEGQPLHRCGQ